MFLLERSVIVFLCNLPMGATGFGDAIVLYVILSFVGSTAAAADTSELNEIIFLLSVGGIGSLGLQAWMLWDKINWELAVWLVVPTVIFCMIGLSILEHLENYALDLKHFLGLIFLAAAMYKVRSEVHLVVSMAEDANNDVVSNKPSLQGPLENSTNIFWTVVAAISSGILAGIYGTPSPPLMVWVSSFRVPKDEWRAVNAIVWLIVNLFRLFHIVVIQSEYKPKDIVEVGSVLCIVGALGSAVGAESSKWIGEYAFRIFIIVLLIFGANTMLFAGEHFAKPLFGIVTTFLVVMFYSFYTIVLDKLPDYPAAHRSRTEQLVISAAEMFRGFFSTAAPGRSMKKNNEFGSVKYSAVTTRDADDEDGEVSPEAVAHI
jgi:uncharacterized membrane protein YfcA